MKCTRACDDNLISILFQDRNFFLQSKARSCRQSRKLASLHLFLVLLNFQFSVSSLHFDPKINKTCVRQLKSRLWAQSIAPRTMIPYRFRSNQTSIGSKVEQFFSLLSLPLHIMSAEKFSLLIFRLPPSGER